MKIHYLIGILLVVLLNSCKEKPVSIKLSNQGLFANQIELITIEQYRESSIEGFNRIIDTSKIHLFDSINVVNLEVAPRSRYWEFTKLIDLCKHYDLNISNVIIGDDTITMDTHFSDSTQSTLYTTLSDGLSIYARLNDQSYAMSYGGFGETLERDNNNSTSGNQYVFRADSSVVVSYIIPPVLQGMNAGFTNISFYNTDNRRYVPYVRSEGARSRFGSMVLEVVYDEYDDLTEVLTNWLVDEGYNPFLILSVKFSYEIGYLGQVGDVIISSVLVNFDELTVSRASFDELLMAEILQWTYRELPERYSNNPTTVSAELNFNIY